MVSYLVVGRTQSGKTSYVKKYIIPKYENALVFDVQNQYPELPFWKREKKGKYRVSPTDMSFNQFIRLGQAITNFLFVYEESTQFLKGQVPPILEANLVGKAHTMNRFVFIFHAIRKIPPGLPVYIDYMVQFNTGSDKTEKMDDDRITEAHEKLRELPRFSKFIHRISDQAMNNEF